MQLRLIVICICIALNAASQQVLYAPSNIDNTVYDFIKIAGQDQNGFFLLQSNISFDTDKDRMGFRNRKYRVSYYDFNLKEKWSRTFAKNDDDIPVENIAFGNNELILAYTDINSTTNIATIFGQTLNSQNIIGPKKTIAQILFNELSELNKIKFSISNNKEKYAFIQNEIKKDNQQVLHIAIADTELKLLHQTKIDIAYEEKNFYFEGWALTDSGDFVMLGSNVSKEKFSNKKKWIGYKLFVAKNGYKSPTEYSLNGNDLFFDGTLLTYERAQNNIVIGGFYSERQPGSSGIFLSKLNLNDNSPPVTIRQPISEGNKAKLQSTDLLDNNPYQLLNYEIRKIILRSDGGAVIIAEASYTSEFSYYDYFSQTYIRRIEYHFENVASFSVNSNGTIDWDEVLRKSQVSTDDYGVYSSFITSVDEEHINFIYNDELDKANSVKCFSLDKNGKSNNKFITKPEDRVLIIPGSGKQISENEIVVPCWQRKNLTLIKITL